MKKYNLSAIMKRAWEIVKKAGATMGNALRQAWAEAKSVKEKFEKSVRVLKEGREGLEDCASAWFTFNRWAKGSMERIYVNDYKRRSVGYIDAHTREIHTEFNETSEAYCEMVRFMEKYEF